MNNSPETSRPTLLLVEDDPLMGEALSTALGRRGYAVEICRTVHDALAHVGAQAPQFAVVDLRLPDGSGLSVVRALHKANPAASTVVLTGYANIATAIEAIKLGARNYLCKPVDADAVAAGLNGTARGSAASELACADAPLTVPVLEWEHIMRVRAEHDNNISATARALGMHRRTLQRKLSKHPHLENAA
jgi:two-component system response regulator RegA